MEFEPSRETLRRDAALAGDLVEAGLSATVAAMRRGEITPGHARVIATSASKPHQKSEAELLDLARTYPPDVCGRHTQAYENHETINEARAAEKAADAELRAQRDQRRVSLRRGDDGIWQLTGRFDHITGRRINQALQAMIKSLRQDTGNDASTYPQRAADALAALITRDSDHLAPRTSLLVIADYDVVAGRLANPRLDDGTPLSAELLAQLAANAKVLPAVFDAKWSNLALGAARNASDAQKLVLAARDGGCIACDAHTENTHAHHIRFFSNGGLTDIPNLASACPPCHKLIHDHEYQVHVQPDEHPKFKPPDHMRLPPDVPTIGELEDTIRGRPPDHPPPTANTAASERGTQPALK